jgi:hypothetical protein
VRAPSPSGVELPVYVSLAFTSSSLSFAASFASPALSLALPQSPWASHGSRFTPDGAVLQGPALEPLCLR